MQHLISRKNKINEYNTSPKLCLCCNKPIEFDDRNINIFCSSSCSATITNSNRIVRRNNNIEIIPKTSPEKLCLFCGKSGVVRTYCSQQCQASQSRKKTNSRIDAGEKVGPIQFKRYLSEKRGHKCEMCALTEWGNKPILLVLDHINGNSSDCSLSNLRQICSNCDTLTPTYKGRNKGQGRFSRKMRYQDGKSF